MKASFPVNQRKICLRVPNTLVFNCITFWLIKLVFGFRFYPLKKMKYKEIKPLIKLVKKYKGHEFVTVNGRNGETVRVFL